jgi:hypothetical protein
MQLVPGRANTARNALDREPWSESDASLEKTVCGVNQILTKSAFSINLCESWNLVQLYGSTFRNCT